MSDVQNVNTVAEGDMSDRYLTFYLGETVYGLELFRVVDILTIPPITPVPGIPSYIKGVTNLRGKIVPVIDVRTKFNQMEVEYTDKTCIIVVVIHDMQVGLIVDSVSDVVTVGPNELTNPPEFGVNESNKYLSTIAHTGGRIILNIDCEKFFANDLDMYSLEGM